MTVSPRSLAQLLAIGEVPDHELRAVIGFYFPAAQHSEGNVIDYMRDEIVALRLTHGRTGIVGVEVGPAWRPEDARELRDLIETSLRQSTGRTIAITVGFGVVPVEGAWRYHDLWQISPAPSEAPRPEHIIGQHPFLLEVAYEASSHNIVSSLRRDALTREVGLLLHGLTGLVRAGGGHSTTFAWVYEPFSGEGELTSTFRQVGYSFPGYRASRDEFSNGHDALRLIDHHEFYARQGISTEQVLDLPESLPALLDAYYCFTAELKDRWLRWAYWLSHSGDVRQMSQSAALLAAVQAIEALCPGEPRREQFRAFLDEFVADPTASPSERTALYNLRSSLAHGGKLMRGDIEQTFAFFYPASINEMMTLQQAHRLARAGGINWLSSQAGLAM